MGQNNKYMLYFVYLFLPNESIKDPQTRSTKKQRTTTIKSNQQMEQSQTCKQKQNTNIHDIKSNQTHWTIKDIQTKSTNSKLSPSKVIEKLKQSRVCKQIFTNKRSTIAINSNSKKTFKDMQTTSSKRQIVTATKMPSNIKQAKTCKTNQTTKS